MFDWLMNRKKRAAERQQEALSAYIDGALSEYERARLEWDLARDPALRAELDELRRTVQMVRALPTLAVPRYFTLDPAIYGRVRPHRVQLYPVLRAATALAALLLVFVFVGDFFLSLSLGAGAPADIFSMEPQAVVMEKEVAGETAAEPDAWLMEAPVEETMVERVEVAEEVAEAEAEVVITQVVEQKVGVTMIVEEEAEVAREAALPTATLTLSVSGAAAMPTPAATQSAEFGMDDGSPYPLATESPAVPTATQPEPSEESADEALPAAGEITPAPPAAPPELAEGRVDGHYPAATTVPPAPAPTELYYNEVEEKTTELTDLEAPAGQEMGMRDATPTPVAIAERAPVNWSLLVKVGMGALALGLFVGTLLARRFGW